MGLRAGRSSRWLAVSGVALTVGLAVPGLAKAAAPAVTTGGAAPVTPTTAVLHGTVDPNGHPTTYFFQFGANTLYGSNSGTQSAGSGQSAASITAGIGGLVPNTLYHYRIVAQYPGGLVKGKDRAVRTKKQPLAMSLAAVPNPVLFGSPVMLSGALTGTGNGNRTVVLQANPFPYTQGFQLAANPQVANAQGGFTFPIVSLGMTTQFRVFLQANPSVAAPVLTVGVGFRMGASASHTHVRRGSKVNFTGTLKPALSGVEVVIQRRRHGRWTTVGRTLSRHRGGAASAKFSKRIRISRGGFYRVEARTSGGNYVTSDSGMISIHAR
jgi:hypothetical protein